MAAPEPALQQPAAAHGHLVDRLMAKIAALEAQLYERELGGGGGSGGDEQLIPAHRSAKDSSRPPQALLAALSEPDRSAQQQQQEQQQQSIERKDWRPSWLARASLARPAADAAQQGGAADSGSGAAWHANLRQYYRYYLSPADMDGETGDVSARVQLAAGAALSEANERLMEAERRVQAAQVAQRQLQEQLAGAAQLADEMEALKEQNLEAWRAKYSLEAQMATYKATLEGLQAQRSAMQKELEDLRQQGAIWGNLSSSELDKLRSEATLLQEQLAARSAELSEARQALMLTECARDAALQEKQQLAEEHARLLVNAQQLPQLHQQLSAAQAAAAQASSAAADWQDRFLKERAVRRKLHEQLQVLRGNIRVMCRVRLPLQPPGSPSRGGGNTGGASCISVPHELEGMLVVHDAALGRVREYEFDAVFAPGASQAQVFEEVSPLVRSCADGFNACIFAYGQTGSGKTHTMEGPAGDPGINTRALQELFAIAAAEGDDQAWIIQLAMLEIYNESVRDLLAMAAAAGAGTAASAGPAAGAAAAVQQPPSLDVSGLPAGELPANMDRVPGLVWRRVSGLSEVTAVLRDGWRGRATAATALNAASSRSHALVSVKVQGRHEGKPFTSLLHLVDLAGSERVDKSEVSGQQLREAQAINKSLSALGDVVAALQRRSAHIPFRNSKLTQVLQDALCGSSKVLLVCNLSPEPCSCGETLSSLSFATRAAQVELGQARRAVPQAAGGLADADGSACCSSTGAAGGDAVAAAGSLPSPTKASSSSSSSNERTSVLRSSAGSGLPSAGGGGGRPSSRLSERAGSSGASGAASPRLSGAKPARH